MSDIFNYWQPTVWSPPPYWAGPDPYAASNANMATRTVNLEILIIITSL